MKLREFLKKKTSINGKLSELFDPAMDMEDVWDSLVERKDHTLLTAIVSQPRVVPSSVLRKLACRFVRETPLYKGCRVWDLLSDPRSINAVIVADRYLDKKTTQKELQQAYDEAEEAVKDARTAVYQARKSLELLTDIFKNPVFHNIPVDALQDVDGAIEWADDNLDAARAAMEVAASSMSHRFSWCAFYAAGATHSRADRQKAENFHVALIAELKNPFKKG